jgi:predicted small lipoprotein YifL
VPEAHRRLPRLAIFAALVAALALAACGRKGPLDPPPASLTDQHPAAGATGAQQGQPQAAKTPEKRIPLDILLN